MSGVPIRGREDFPRDRMECLSRSPLDRYPMQWRASGSSENHEVSCWSLESDKKTFKKTSPFASFSDHENMLSSAEPLKPKSRSSKEVELLSPVIP